MQNQIDYKNGAQLIANEYVESQLIYGSAVPMDWSFSLKRRSANDRLGQLYLIPDREEIRDSQ